MRMIIKDIRAKIDRLNRASCLYYNGYESFLSDDEFDNELEELKRLEQKYQIFYSDSPNQTVGSPVLNELKKINIIDKPMLSLEKVHSAEEIRHFTKEQDLIASIKCDGVSVRLIYKNTKLISANTRGNGYVGSDITEHIKNFMNVPLMIPKNEAYIIDGEAIIYDNDFSIINKNNNFKNSRNTTSGALSLLNMQEVKQRKLNFIAWDVIEGGAFNQYYSNLKEAENLGFTIVPNEEIKNDIVQCGKIKEINQTLLMKAKKEGIPCDGVVWRINDIKAGDLRGKTSHHFLNAVAWKPAKKEYETTLQGIEWQIGRTGVLTPVAYFTPIDIGGTRVSKASLHNIGVIESLSPLPWYAGYKLTVFKANEIIPQISAVTPAEPEGAFMFDVPKVCPSCGEPVSIQQNGAVKIAVCKNPKCTTSRIEKIIHYTSKKGMDITGLSEATITKLWDKGWLKDIVDIYTLKDHRDEWIQMEGFGPKSVDNILAAIEKSKNTTFPTFISALGIPFIGKTVAKDLMNYFSSYEELMDAIVDGFNFSTIDKFGPAKDKALKEFDWSSADYIYENYLDNFTTFVQEYASIDTLKNTTVCITGKLQQVKNRNQFKEIITAAGGRVTDSVTKKVNYLINNDINSSSSKNKKAKELGIEIITEGDFIKKFGLNAAIN